MGYEAWGFNLHRLNVDGTRDTVFVPYPLYPSGDSPGAVYLIEEQADGTLLVGGRRGSVILTADGQLRGGHYRGSYSSAVYGHAKSPDGRTFIAGYGFTNNTAVAEIRSPYGASAFSPVDLGQGYLYGARVLKMDGCGHLLVAGLPLRSLTNHGAIVGLNLDGSISPTFPKLKIDGVVETILRLPDESWLVGGNFSRINGVTVNGIARISTPLPKPVISAISPDQSLTAGRPVTLVVTFDVCSFPPVEWYRDGVAIPGATNNSLEISNPQPGMSGRYTVVASNESDTVTSEEIAVTIDRSHFSPGRLDSDFRISSTWLTNVTAMAMQNDGKLILSGRGPQGRRVIRVRSDGTIDESFASNYTDEVLALCVDSTDRIIIGSHYHIRRLSPTGVFEKQNSDWGASILQMLAPSVVLANVHGSIVRLDTDSLSQIGGFTYTSGGFYALSRQRDNRWIVAGDFNSIGGASANRIGRVLETGGFDPSFSAGTGPSATVRAVAATDTGRILIAGDFKSYNGSPRSHFAALDSSGALDPEFGTNAMPNTNVYAIALQRDGKIIIAGDFSSLGGVPRAGIARLHSNGELDTTFDPGLGVPRGARSLLIDKHGRIYVAGTFTHYEDAPRAGIARVHGEVVVSAGGQSDGVSVQAFTSSGWNYVLERSTSLVQPDWSPVFTVTGDGTVQSLTNKPAESTGFYRVRVE